MYIDQKVTVWIRSTIQCNYEDMKALESEIHSLLQNGKSVNDICTDLALETTYETLVETEQPITPEEDGGEATVEFFNDLGQLIFDNSTATK